MWLGKVYLVQTNIQDKWKEASKDIEESKKSATESGAEDQQKEKLQTKLEKLTAQKNAIEQKKQALLIERLTTFCKSALASCRLIDTA
jgi:seryl-tRNA synthetase